MKDLAIKYEKSCGFVLICNNKILLLHYPSGHWDFPKGHTDTDETETQTALRELREETGIENPMVLEGFRCTCEYTYKREHWLYKKKVVYFLASTNTHNVTLSDEHQNYAWLEWPQALEKVTFENSHDILLKARSHWKQQHTRV